MMPLIIPITLLLLFGFWLASSRRGIWLRVAIIAAVPIGALLGGYCGSEICYVILRQQGRGESHNDIMPVAASGMAGLIVGGIVLPLIILFLTKSQKRDDHVA
jgi:hypothetical protein